MQTAAACLLFAGARHARSQLADSALVDEELAALLARHRCETDDLRLR